jgi:DNA-binding NarL/FixJ family response regulator
MPRVFVSESQGEVRSALRLMLVDLQMQVVGEAATWAATLALIAATHAQIMLVHWGLLPEAAGPALAALRVICPGLCIIVLSGQPWVRQAALKAGANAFISKGEAPDRVAQQLLAAARGAGIS